jgi:hypothetical protein
MPSGCELEQLSLMSEMKIDAAAPTQREKTVRVTARPAVVRFVLIVFDV